MKKILIACSLLVGVSAANAVAPSGGSLVAGANAVSTTDCALLASAVSITLSTGNVGAYQCSASTANIGLAVASTTGKNKIFSVGSSGGAITTTETRASPSLSELDSAASTSSGDAVSGQTSTEQATTTDVR